MYKFGDFSAYVAWVRDYDTLDDAARSEIRARVAMLARRPMFSIVVPNSEGRAAATASTLASLRAQLYPDWELWLPRGAAGPPEPPQGSSLSLWERAGVRVTRAPAESSNADHRIRLLPPMGRDPELAAIGNAAIALASGDFVLPVPAGAVLAEDALYELAAALGENPDTRMIFTDEDRLDAGGNRCLPFFKTAWDPDFMLGRDAVGPLAAYRKDLLAEIGGASGGARGFDLFLYDLALRAGFAAGAKGIRHVPAVLCHRPTAGCGGWDAEAARERVRGLLAGRGERADVVPAPLAPEWNRIVYPLPDPAPLVSIIVPTRDKTDLLARCAEGILSRTDYPAIELLVVDNGSRDPAALNLLHGLAADRRVRVLDFPEKFNFGTMNNKAARQAHGEVLVLLNNDVEVIGTGWLRELVAQALRPDVGAVGAKLLYPDGRVQHGGIVLGPGPVAAHQFRFANRDNPGPNGELALARTVSAVTGACLAVRRSVFLEVGGIEEARFAVEFNDIDFCLRVGSRGYRIVWTPHAELLHHESSTRGLSDTEQKVAVFEAERACFGAAWGSRLDSDPYYSPNLLCDPSAATDREATALAAPPRRAFPRAAPGELSRLDVARTEALRMRAERAEEEARMERAKVEQAEARAIAERSRADALKAASLGLAAELARTKEERDAMLASTSWRMSWPIRAAGKRVPATIRRAFGKPRDLAGRR